MLNFNACKGAHTLFIGLRERKRERKRKKEREKERKRERERGRERERERERERCTIWSFLFLKGMNQNPSLSKVWLF